MHARWTDDLFDIYRDPLHARWTDDLLDIYIETNLSQFQKALDNELVLLFLCWKEETVFVNANLEASLAN